MVLSAGNLPYKKSSPSEVGSKFLAFEGRFLGKGALKALVVCVPGTGERYTEHIRYTTFERSISFENRVRAAHAFAWRDLSYRAKNIANYYKYRIGGDHRLLSRVYFNDTII